MSRKDGSIGGISLGWAVPGAWSSYKLAVIQQIIFARATDKNYKKTEAPLINDGSAATYLL